MSEAAEATKVAVTDQLLKKLLSPAYTGRMLRYFADHSDLTNISDVFDGSDYSDLVYDVLTPLPREQIKDLFRPLMADAICRTIGAQKVAIDW